MRNNILPLNSYCSYSQTLSAMCNSSPTVMAGFIHEIRNPADTHIMVILSALQITFLFIIVSPCIWSEAHSVVFLLGSQSFPVLDDSTQSLGIKQLTGFGKGCLYFSSIYVFGYLYGNE